MMTFPHPGTAYLSTRAMLQHPQIAWQDNFISVTVDATFCCSYPVEGTHVHASLFYIKKSEHEQVPPGIYDIDAKVSNLHHLYHKHHTQHT